MIRIGVFNVSGRSAKPEPMIIKSEGSEPDPPVISYYASKEANQHIEDMKKQS